MRKIIQKQGPGFLLKDLSFQGLSGLPVKVEKNLVEQINSLLPETRDYGQKTLIEETAIFKRVRNPDPILAIKIGGQWYSLFEWE
jgi:hypothetical protein